MYAKSVKSYVFHLKTYLFSNPTPDPVNNPLGGSTLWPEFTYEAMDIQFFGPDSIKTMTEYRQKDYAFWGEYLINIAGDELGVYGRHMFGEF